MTSSPPPDGTLPDRPDLGQLRRRAKELKRAVLAGDDDARARVLSAHPVYVDRDPVRLQADRFTLRDAQLTVAREHGAESWAALVAEVEHRSADAPPRSTGGSFHRIDADAFEEANRTASDDHAYVTGRDYLLAVLRADRPSVARDVLADLGVTYEAVRERLHRPARYEGPLYNNPDREVRVSSTPAGQMLIAFASGFAVATGSPEVTPEHVLLALAFERDGSTGLVEADVDPDDVIGALAARGVDVGVRPPVPARPWGPRGPIVYVRKEDFAAVRHALIGAHPPGTARWGTNSSSWRPTMYWFTSEDIIDLAGIARAAVGDPSSVEVIDLATSVREEAAARKRAGDP